MSSESPPEDVVPTEGQSATTVPSASPTTTPTPGARGTARQSPGPGAPQTPVTGPLQTPTTARAIDPRPRPAGVPDQVFPPGTKAYELLANGDCEALLVEIVGDSSSWVEGNIAPSSIHPYSAAGHACLSHWADAESHFRLIDTRAICVESVQGMNNSFDDAATCQDLRMSVYLWTARLLKAHQADPAFVPNFPPKA